MTRHLSQIVSRQDHGVLLAHTSGHVTTRWEFSQANCLNRPATTAPTRRVALAGLFIVVKGLDFAAATHPVATDRFGWSAWPAGSSATASNIVADRCRAGGRYSFRIGRTQKSSPPVKNSQSSHHHHHRARRLRNIRHQTIGGRESVNPGPVGGGQRHGTPAGRLAKVGDQGGEVGAGDREGAPRLAATQRGARFLNVRESPLMPPLQFSR